MALEQSANGRETRQGAAGAWFSANLEEGGGDSCHDLSNFMEDLSKFMEEQSKYTYLDYSSMKLDKSSTKLEESSINVEF